MSQFYFETFKRFSSGLNKVVRSTDKYDAYFKATVSHSFFDRFSGQNVFYPNYNCKDGIITRGEHILHSVNAILPDDHRTAVWFMMVFGITERFRRALMNLGKISSSNWSGRSEFLEYNGKVEVLNIKFDLPETLMKTVAMMVTDTPNGYDVGEDAGEWIERDFDVFCDNKKKEIPKAEDVKAPTAEGVVNTYLDKIRDFPEGKVKKKDNKTYLSEDDYKRYLKSQGADRLRDTIKILMQVPHEKVLAIGDGVGIAQMACKLLGKECVSYDTSPIAVSIAKTLGNKVIQSTFEVDDLRRYPGYLVYLSHVMDFIPNFIRDMRLKGYEPPMVVFEKDFFLGFSTMQRFSYRGACYYQGFSFMGGPLHLSGERHKQQIGSTYDRILKEKNLMIANKKLEWLLETTAGYGIKGRFQIRYMNHDLELEVLKYYNHEYANSVEYVGTYGPIDYGLLRYKKIIDFKTGERHWKIFGNDRCYLINPASKGYKAKRESFKNIIKTGVKYFFPKKTRIIGMYSYSGDDYECFIFPKGQFTAIIPGVGRVQLYTAR